MHGDGVFTSCLYLHSIAHNDGTMSTLLNLEGTIPIFYRGNQYNIPVEFWVVEAYPMSPPVCFVRPTPGKALYKRCCVVLP